MIIACSDGQHGRHAISAARQGAGNPLIPASTSSTISTTGTAQRRPCRPVANRPAADPVAWYAQSRQQRLSGSAVGRHISRVPSAARMLKTAVIGCPAVLHNRHGINFPAARTPDTPAAPGSARRSWSRARRGSAWRPRCRSPRASGARPAGSPASPLISHISASASAANDRSMTAAGLPSAAIRFTTRPSASRMSLPAVAEHVLVGVRPDAAIDLDRPDRPARARRSRRRSDRRWRAPPRRAWPPGAAR